MAAPQPLPYYLRSEKRLDASFNRTLEEASKEASRAIGQLMGSNTFSNRVRAAQIALVRREVLSVTKPMWEGLSTDLDKGLRDAVAEAAKYSADTVDPFFDALDIDPGPFNQARLVQNYNTLDAYKARTANNIPLSTQVYRTQALADGLVGQAVDSGILLGKNAREIAKDVKGFIQPDVPGGVSYAAKRLGRTELNNAFHTATVNTMAEEPWTEAIKWNLSGSHPKKDKCNEYAEHRLDGYDEEGVWPKGEVPKKPHPQCLCYMTAVEEDEEDFFDSFFKGEFDGYLKETFGEANISSESTMDLVKKAQDAGSVTNISKKKR